MIIFFLSCKDKNNAKNSQETIVDKINRPLLRTKAANPIDNTLLRTIVLIEKVEGNSYAPLGTGFLVYNEGNTNQPFVVTCAHLVNQKEIFITINAHDEMLKVAQPNNGIVISNCKWMKFGKKLKGKIILSDLSKDEFIIDKPLDIAIFKINLGISLPCGGKDIQFLKTEQIHKEIFITSKRIDTGREVFFGGFPLNIGNNETLEPVVRFGKLSSSISKNEYLIDSISLGGNSGSPVFTCPAINIDGGSFVIEPEYFIGMVVGHIGIKEQNYGLVRCVWAKDILSLIIKMGNR